YLKDTEHPNLQHITSLQRIDREDYLWMDRLTIRNLELTGNAWGQETSLHSVLDNTVSPMGARLLKRWMLLPLKDIQKIPERLDLVEYLIREPELRSKLTQNIKQCGDIERLAGKIPFKKIGPREVLHLARALQHIRDIRQLCAQASASATEGAACPVFLDELAGKLDDSPPIVEKILAQISEHAPALAIKGNVIRPGVHEELDKLRSIATGGKEYLAALQQKEAEATGISSLKIAFNNVFGYYLEVTNSHKNKVPAEWMRKQTLTNAERYITPELKEYEEKITGAEEKIMAIELDLYDQLLLDLQDYIAPIQVNAHLLASLDCLLCFADNALRNNYKKPVLHEGAALELKESRHPVIERNLPPGEAYIANDIVLDPESNQIIILTGPNMSGKSALLRQTALITLMAHMGSFVPADSAR
ncbi:MAG: DNA mismatch repair protein MutS, partial [Bacteroidetes bacterium]|nr:DNA mismatch repair protein MutS [Bacteroidota bacterium]